MEKPSQLELVQFRTALKRFVDFTDAEWQLFTCHCKPRFTTVNKFMLQALGIFNKQIGETAELYYQYQNDYIFDSSRFENVFGVKPTPNAEGLKEFGGLINQVISGGHAQLSAVR
jgi:hypothetical protein